MARAIDRRGNAGRPANKISVSSFHPRPFGLPKKRTVEDYRRDPVCALSARNYRLNVAIGASSTRFYRALSVLDTGAGPNVVRASCVPEEARKTIDKEREVVNLTSASRDPLKVLGIVHLHVKVGDYTCRQPFVVVEDLSAEVLLGTTFIDAHVEVIWVRRRCCILRDRSTIYLARRSSTAFPPDEPKEVTPPPRAPDLKVRIARPAILAPRSETHVTVTMTQSGRYMLEPNDQLFARKSVALAHGVQDAQANRPFIVRMANFSERKVVLPKNQVVGTGAQSPEWVLPIDVNTLVPDDKGLPASKPEEANRKTIPPGLLSRIPPTPDGEVKTTTPVPPGSLADVQWAHLDDKQRKAVLNMLAPYAKMWDGSLGEVSTSAHRIDTPDDVRPFRSQPYRAGPKQRELIETEINRQLEMGVITPSKSEWASPVLLVPKSDGSWRFCVDYRRLNQMTLKDSYPLSRMDECLDSLGDAAYFTTLDANSGYWQMKVHPPHRHKTALVCHRGVFEYNRMPFGLCTAPASFQRTVDIVLSGFRWKSCLVYLDDVIVFSKNFDEHLSHVSEVLTALRNAGFSLNLKKCEFFKQQVDYLGHVIRPGKLSVALKTTEAVAGFHPPKTQTHVKSFLGLCNVYRRFVPNFARVAAPLNALLKKGKPYTLDPLTEEVGKSIARLKEALTSAPILALPRAGLPYSMDTDACDYQVGVSLLQHYPDGTRHPIGYWSRSLCDAEKNYSVTEKECLAVVWGCQILRPYLEGEHFTVYTDHQALKWLLGATDVSGRLARWRIRLSEFDLALDYKKGKKNTIADAISRLPTNGETNVDPDLDIPVLQVNTDSSVEGAEEDILDDEDRLDDLTASVHTVEPPLLTAIQAEEVIREQSTDEYCLSLRDKLDNGHQIPFEVDEDGTLVRVSPRDFSRQMVIPKALRERLLHLTHHSKSGAHAGGLRMYSTLRRYAYWPCMAVDVYNVVRNCPSCARQRIKLRRHHGFLKLFPATKPGEQVAIDLLGPLPRTRSGFEYILVITDRFSKMTKVHPLRGIGAYQVARAFCSEWVYHYGQPSMLLSDRGSQFTSTFFRNVCNILGVKQAFTSAYHPQTNGQTERFNRTLVAALRCFCSEHGRDWDTFLQGVAYGYNCTVHTATRCTPFELMLTHPPRPLALAKADKVDHSELPVQNVKDRMLRRLESLMDTAQSALNKAQSRYKRNFDARVTPSSQTYKVGDLVYVRREAVRVGESFHKLRSPTSDARPILRVLREARCAIVRLEDGTESTVSFDRLALAKAAVNHEGRSSINDPGVERERPQSTSPPASSAPVSVPQTKVRFADPSRDEESKNSSRPPFRSSTPRSALRSSPKLGDSTFDHMVDREPVAHRTRSRRRVPVATVGPPRDARAEIRDAANDPFYRRVDVIGYHPEKNIYRVRWSNLPPRADTYEHAAHIPRHFVDDFRQECLLPPLPAQVWN